jgi:hypothetical protein
MKELFEGYRNHFTQNFCKFPEPLSLQVFSSKACPTFLLMRNLQIDIVHVTKQLYLHTGRVALTWAVPYSYPVDITKGATGM